MGPPFYSSHRGIHVKSGIRGGANMADRDIGNKLLKFILSEEVRPFYVVEIYNVRT